MKKHTSFLLSLLMLCLPVFSGAAESAAPVRASRPFVAKRLSVCVYCGASNRTDPKYIDVARQMGERIARSQWTLVWGGGQAGLMGAVARGAKETGGRVVGITTDFLDQREPAYGKADEMIIVATMAERKFLLQARSDVFVVLPGGIGTLDEIGDTLDLKNLSRHRKPIILLNQDGYYDSLLAFLDRSIAEKFSKDDARSHLIVVRTLDEAMATLQEIERGSEISP